MLHVAYMKPQAWLELDTTPLLQVLNKKIHALKQSVFISFTKDRAASILYALNNGICFLIFAFIDQVLVKL